MSALNRRRFLQTARTFAALSQSAGATYSAVLKQGPASYFSTQTSRIVALEPETGKEVWTYDPKVRRPREHREVGYWPGDRKTPARIVFGTGEGSLRLTT
jgi:glucose dehydrogenase